MIDFDKPFKKEISILGETYTFILENAKDNSKYDDMCVDGYFDSSVKEMHVAISEQDTRDKKNLSVYRKSVSRHEIIHAFLYESGLDASTNTYSSWATNEEMVDWFALQSPKMFKVFKELEILE